MSALNIDPRKPEKGWARRWATQTLDLGVAGWPALLVFLTLYALGGMIQIASLLLMSGSAGMILGQGVGSAVAGCACLVFLRDIARIDGHPTGSLRDMAPRLREFAALNFLMTTVFCTLMVAIPSGAQIPEGAIDMSGPRDVTLAKIIVLSSQMNLSTAFINAGVVGVSSMALAACMNFGGIRDQAFLAMVTMQKMFPFYMGMTAVFMALPLAAVFLPFPLAPLLTYALLVLYYVTARDIYGHIDKNGTREEARAPRFAT